MGFRGIFKVYMNVPIEYEDIKTLFKAKKQFGKSGFRTLNESGPILDLEFSNFQKWFSQEAVGGREFWHSVEVVHNLYV